MLVSSSPAADRPSRSRPFRFAIHQAAPVPTVAPYRGFTLLELDERDGCGFYTREFAARGPDGDVLLDVSRFFFTPTSERFAWLVDNGFPRAPSIGPWCDAQIDAAIAAGRREAA